jgi:hypothetical protein
MSNNANNRPSRLQETRDEIRAALSNSPYRDQPALNRLYIEGLLTELLAYSAQNLYEVKARLRDLAERSTKPKSEQ